MAQHYVYRFYAELKEYSPKIWRRFEINGEKTMAELGYAIMLMFEMQASHLFCLKENTKENFLTYLQTLHPEDESNSIIEELLASPPTNEILKNIRYELAYEDAFVMEDEQLIEADRIKLNQVTKYSGSKFTFNYDFGDGWEIDLTLEECEKREVPLSILPRVLEGKGFGIIEDVGGPGGLERLSRSLKKGKGEEYEDDCSWLDSTTLDLDAFDIDDINFRLKKLIRVYRDCYERRYEPTEKSLSILLREYQDKGSRGY